MIQSRKTLQQIKPYIPGKSIQEAKAEAGLDHVVKMASNENPLGPSVSFKDLQSELENCHLYPHQETSGLFELLAKKYSIQNYNLILGNGSDELIQLLAFAYLNEHDTVVTTQHTFSEYAFITYLMNAKLIEVPTNPDYSFNFEAILKSITTTTKLIFLANPNNPTGLMFSHEVFVNFLKQVPLGVIVVIDEAYAEYVEDAHYPQSAALLDNFKNVVILRTFSKLYGLAGLRIGYGMAHEIIIETLKKVRPPFNVNSIALSAAKAALMAKEHIQKSLQLNHEGKAFFYKAFTELNLPYLKTEANFICFFTPILAQDLAKQLLQKGYIVRALTSFNLPYGIRVTIHLPEHNQGFINALKACLNP